MKSCKGLLQNQALFLYSFCLCLHLSFKSCALEDKSYGPLHDNILSIATALIKVLITLRYGRRKWKSETFSGIYWINSRTRNIQLFLFSQPNHSSIGIWNWVKKLYRKREKKHHCQLNRTVKDLLLRKMKVY